MAKFRDSAPEAAALDGTAPAQPARPKAVPPSLADTASVQPERNIGDIIAELRNLTAEQVERVLQRQRETGVRFGEAAVALGLASKEIGRAHV